MKWGIPVGMLLFSIAGCVEVRMANPWGLSRTWAKLSNMLTRPLWSILPAPRGFGILTTIGRRSGKPRPQSVRAIREGDAVYVVAMMGERAAWLKNVRANPRVTVRLGRETLDGSAREITDSGERRRATDIYVGTVVFGDYPDYFVYQWGLPTRSKIVRALQQWFEDGIPVIIQLESGEPEIA